MLHFDPNPGVYFLIGYGLLWVCGLLALLPERPLSARPWWQNRLVFLVLAAVSLIYMRLPILGYNQELNPDESQLVAQGMTLAEDPVFWQSVDGTTSGPLISYPLTLLGWLGLPYDYITARLLGISLILLTLWLTFRTAETWFGERVARWAILPIFFLLSITQHPDIVHYTSEHIPVAIMAGVFYLLAREQTKRMPSRWNLLLAGLLAALSPFSKLQCIPMIFCGILFIVIDLFARRNLNWKQKLIYFGWLVAGGVGPLVLVLGLTLIFGVFDDMLLFYLKGNFQYGIGRNDSQWKKLLILPDMFRSVEEFGWFALLTVTLGVVFMVVWARQNFRLATPLRISAFIGLLLPLTWMAVTRTGSGYLHYLLFCISSFTFLNSIFLYQIKQSPFWQNRTQWIGGLLLVASLLPFGIRWISWAASGHPLNRYVQYSHHIPKSDVANEILRYAEPGEKLVVWGWMCNYYVETQMPQGVSENHSIRSAFVHPLRDAYRARYMQDITRSFPPVFVDAVGHSLWMNDRATQGYESFPQLRNFIDAHYRFVRELNKTRIYVRYDRYRSANGQVANSTTYVD